MSNVIKAQVAQILDNRTLAISAGTDKNVKVGMRFKIFSAKKIPIIDPSTNESLGELDNEKLRVRVVEVEAKYSIAETYEYETVNTGGGYGNSIIALNKMFQEPKIEKRYRTFEIEKQDRKAIDEKESFVRIGDRVEQVIEINN